MKTQDLEITVNRLLVGYTVLKVDNKKIIYRNSDADTRYKISMFLHDFYSKNRFNFYKKDRLEATLVARNLLEGDYKEAIKNLYEKVDDLKFDLFMTGPLVERAKNVRQKLKSTRDYLSKYLSNIDRLFHYSIEETSNRIEATYSVLLNCFYDNGDLVFDVNNVDYPFFKITSEELQKLSLNSKDLREIARSNVWRSYWGRGKERCFTMSPSNFSDEQKLLCSYSTMYDNAFSRGDFPEHIIDDDDLFDGWMIKQRKDAEDAGKESANKAGKHYDFVFKPATTQEEANNVYNLNTRQGKEQIQARGQKFKKEIGRR